MSNVSTESSKKPPAEAGNIAGDKPVELPDAPCVEMSEGVARYILALFDLNHDGEAPTQAELARELGVSQPSALQMVRRIREMGLVDAEELTLTPSGTSAALVLTSRRTAARDLTHDVLGLDEDEAQAEAEHLASSATPAFGRKLVAWRARRG